METSRVRKATFPRVSRRTPLEKHFLRRLVRLTRLSTYGQQHLVFSDGEAALLRKATYSVYRDCVDLGLTREARRVIGGTAG